MKNLQRLAWVVVAGMALATSWWSLYSVALHYGIPHPLAVGFSSIFDGAALICGDLERRHAEKGYSGLVPRMALLGLLAGSVYLNRAHAIFAGYGRPAQIAFAGPAVVAVALYDLEMRWAHREALSALRDPVPALPPLGRWSWTFHPGRSIRAIWRISRKQVDAAETRALATVEAETGRLLADLSGTTPDTVRDMSGPVRDTQDSLSGIVRQIYTEFGTADIDLDTLSAEVACRTMTPFTRDTLRRTASRLRTANHLSGNQQTG